MDITIDGVRNNLRVIDKDYLTNITGDKIINIDIDDNEYDITINKVVHIVSILLGLNNVEEDIYYVILSNISKANDNMEDSTVITFGKNEINAVRIMSNTSESLIRKYLSRFIDRKILSYYTNTNGIPVNGKFILNPKYDLTKHFANINNIKSIIINI